MNYPAARPRPPASRGQAFRPRASESGLKKRRRLRVLWTACLKNVEQAIAGKLENKKFLLITLLYECHVLSEDVPGEGEFIFSSQNQFL
jgi:hypothetical protein